MGFWASEGSSYLVAGESNLVAGAYSQPFWSHDYVPVQVLGVRGFDRPGLWRKLFNRSRGHTVIPTTFLEPRSRYQHRLLGVRAFELRGRWRKLFGRGGIFTTNLEP